MKSSYLISEFICNNRIVCSLWKSSIYTVKCEDRLLSEANDFFERMEQEKNYKKQLDRLVRLMQNMGNQDMGAKFDLFRHERHCVALPPPRIQNIDLRLYCHWINDRIVILYNGGIKSKPKAQDCPNVSSHFYNAQSWTKQLNNIGIETNGNEIINLDDLTIKF